MRQLNHPNLLPLYCSFVHKEHLWMVMPYVQGGSVLNIMRFAYPDVSTRWAAAPVAGAGVVAGAAGLQVLLYLVKVLRAGGLHCAGVHRPAKRGVLCVSVCAQGLEEPVIATIMKDVLKALEYLHRQGIIHRDIKVGGHGGGGLGSGKAGTGRPGQSSTG